MYNVSYVSTVYIFVRAYINMGLSIVTSFSRRGSTTRT